VSNAAPVMAADRQLSPHGFNVVLLYVTQHIKPPLQGCGVVECKPRSVFSRLVSTRTDSFLWDQAYGLVRAILATKRQWSVLAGA